jgi:endonuclease YncB( thermonuclease family)
LRRAVVPGVLLVVAVALYALFGGGSPRLIDGAGRRVLVADGDTLKVWGETIRLAGLDAVERTQFCMDEKGAGWSCGESAKEALEAVVAKGALTCSALSTDRYGRTIARCRVRDGDVGAALVQGGRAVSDGNTYATEEATAREAKRGIWAGTFEAPSVWRERNGVTPKKVEE